MFHILVVEDNANTRKLMEAVLTQHGYQPILACDGIEACRAALMKASRGQLPENFIEGMACEGGCIGGAGCLTHGLRDRNEVDRYGRQAREQRIDGAIDLP